MVFQLEDNWRQCAFVANTISSTMNAALLWITLSRRKELTRLKLPGLSRQLPAMLMMAAAALGLAYWLHESVAAPAGGRGAAAVMAGVYPLLGAGLVYCCWPPPWWIQPSLY